MIETSGTFQFEIKRLAATGEVEGLAAAYGNVDRQGDVVAPGAFTASLIEHKARGTAPAMLLHHDLARPVGRWTAFEETQAGLFVRGALALDTADGREAYALLKGGGLAGLSVGFTKPLRKHGTSGAATIQSADLLEVSFVAVPANPNAKVTGVKSIPGAREIEAALNGAGLSNRQSKAGAAAVLKAISANDHEAEEAERFAKIMGEARAQLKPFVKRN